MAMTKVHKYSIFLTKIHIFTVEKMKDPTMLAQIALEDENSEIRKTAEIRLQELR
jgi:hypothetical protein